jgi:hypothetical protein
MDSEFIKRYDPMIYPLFLKTGVRKGTIIIVPLFLMGR